MILILQSKCVMSYHLLNVEVKWICSFPNNVLRMQACSILWLLRWDLQVFRWQAIVKFYHYPSQIWTHLLSLRKDDVARCTLLAPPLWCAWFDSHMCTSDFRHGVPGWVPQLGTGNREAAAAALIQTSSLNGLEPSWVRPAPPRLPPQQGEVCTSIFAFCLHTGSRVWLVPIDISHRFT